MLTIRSRVRGDLESLNKIMSGLGPIEEGKGTDYRYRARALKQEVAATFSGMIEGHRHGYWIQEATCDRLVDVAGSYADIGA